jgi:hypothetical protein
MNFLTGLILIPLFSNKRIILDTISNLMIMIEHHLSVDLKPEKDQLINFVNP